MSREEAIKILEEPPLSENEAMRLFSEVARKLNISEEELLSYHKLPHVIRKYKSNQWAFNLGIKLYTLLGLDKRIRK